jgi:hypothetical protein
MGEHNGDKDSMETRSPSEVVVMEFQRKVKASGHPSADTLDYVADMLLELKTLAESTQCETLTSLIEIAAREAHLRHIHLK